MLHNKILKTYKTELCDKYETKEGCPYGQNCCYAHGKKEQREMPRDNKYKQQKCKYYNDIGQCPYGIKCNFRHAESKQTIEERYKIIATQMWEIIGYRPLSVFKKFH